MPPQLLLHAPIQPTLQALLHALEHPELQELLHPGGNPQPNCSILLFNPVLEQELPHVAVHASIHPFVQLLPHVAVQILEQSPPQPEEQSPLQEELHELLQPRWLPPPPELKSSVSFSQEVSNEVIDIEVSIGIENNVFLINCLLSKEDFSSILSFSIFIKTNELNFPDLVGRITK